MQRFPGHAATPMLRAPEVDDDANARAIALARLILDDEVTVQAPPNLSADVAPMLAAGVNDLGGISPLTPDFINRTYAWPHLDRLDADCAAAGFTLTRRLPIHEPWLRSEFVAPEVMPHLTARSAA